MKKKNYVYYNYVSPYLYFKGKKVNDNNECYLILKKYKVPNFLFNVFVVKQTLKEADYNLVYIGKDKNNKTQYIYGDKYVENRRKQKLLTFLKVEDKRKEINKYLNKNKLKRINKNTITLESIISLIITLEFTFYIRTGRIKYSKENNTTGLLTLKKKHFTINKNDIIIQFKGKKSISYKFILDILTNEYVFNYLSFLYKQCRSNDSYIFSINNKFIGEYHFYKTLKEIGITLKEIRTYCSNNILIKELWKYISSNPPRKKNMKRIISDVLDITSNTIGHSKSISRKSYVIDFLTDDNCLEIIMNNFEDKGYEKFYNFILLKLNEWK